ncbi:DUF2513 domain-containing protein [Achromobacter xylosoxidans]|uniref:DUF2513 domain-containing protein n=1 Tax=Alcaligenes xylosoxydans xylosoxydans TaxID=85698 RepID=UPI000479874B|nr:DUF2513 domain-containing protein [Achromobacter xylosoxidans]
MNRNMDIVRRIAIKASEIEYGQTVTELDGVSAEEFAMHVIWMEEAGLVVAHTQQYQMRAPDAEVSRLTWEGCEFVDAVRDDTLWRKAKDSVLRPASSFTFSLLKDWLRAELQQGFPTLRRLG